MGSESVASCRQTSPASPGSPLLNKAQNVQNNTFERIPNKGACFFCHEEGHWVRDCPSRSNPTPGSGSPTAGRRSYQELQCPCGYGACIVLTSWTAKNPGRDFYRCPGKQVLQQSGVMGSESVASCRQTSPASPGSPLLNKAQNVQNTTFERIPNKGACFFCHEEGHWVRDCPSRSNPTPGSGSPTAGRRSYQELQCPCGYGACIVLTSRTAKNPGRDFYRCPGKQSEQCGFFKWCDEIASSQIPKFKSPIKTYRQQHDVINDFANHGLKSPMNHGKQHSAVDHLYPVCSCGAGKCILMTMHDGENAGRKYFACPIKKGQGACNHFQWYDSPMNAKKLEHSDCLLEKPNRLSQDHKDACEAINIIKTEGTVAPVSPILQDQMFRREQQASNRERELKNQGAYKTEHSDHLLNKTDPPTLDNKQAWKAINVSEAKDTVAPVSPLLKQDQRDAFLQISPVKRLSLEDGSPDAGSSKLKRCLKFGGEGHWLNEHEHTASPSSPCFKCGRFAQHSSG